MVQIMLSQTLGFNRGQLTSKYLGIPLVLLYNRVSTWEELIERTHPRVNDMSIGVGVASLGNPIYQTCHQI